MDLRDIICIFWYKDDNIFLDEDGKAIYNIYDYITPDDLYLFREGIRSCFSMVDTPDIEIRMIVCDGYLADYEIDYDASWFFRDDWQLKILV